MNQIAILALFPVILVFLLTVSIVQRQRLKRTQPGSIVCPACGAVVGEKPKLSSLGFISSRCSACSLEFDQPLPVMFRAAYILLAVLVVVGSIANGPTIISVLYLLGIAAALYYDIRAVRRFARRAEMNQGL